MSGFDTLPRIDVAALSDTGSTAIGAVAAEIGAACREVGFFAIHGHGVPPELVEATFDANQRFFALPLAHKRRLGIDRLGGNRGYVGLGVEALDERRGADHKEAFNVAWNDAVNPQTGAWPELAGFQPVVTQYFQAVLALGRRLHRAFAADLGLPEEYFADKLDRPQAVLRLLHYPGSSAAGDDPTLGAGTHTDYGNVTLLATDGVPGLQVQSRDGRWVDVPELPGHFVCNIGDCLMRWTNDVYVSTPHRVRMPREPRRSLAVFVDPNPDARVEAIASCVPAGTVPRYAAISAQAYLAGRLAATYARPG